MLGVHILGSTTTRFVRARPIWNQHAYHVTNVDTAGNIPTNEPENWLLGGLNNYRVNAFLPTDDEQFDRFIYQASDGLLNSNDATVTINMAPAMAPPRIDSDPVETASVGFEYFYNVQASEPNGDTLTFSLTLAPVGMTIDASTGLISWNPSAADAGSVSVVVQVADPGGLTDSQAYVIAVGGATLVPDVVGFISGGCNVGHSGRGSAAWCGDDDQQLDGAGRRRYQPDTACGHSGGHWQ